MRKVYITFGGAPYDKTTRLIVEGGPIFGADEVRVYDDRWLLGQPFYKQNAWLWSHQHRRGFGWYAWKPYIIWHALSSLSYGDVVLFTDADCFPIASLRPLFETCARDGGVMLFASEGHRHGDWCKRDCFIVMAQDEPRIYDAPAGVARFMLFQKGPWLATQFLMEWLAYCVNPLANTFDKSVLGVEPPQFVEHRAEQAILTNLAYKHGIVLHREACEAGNGSVRDRALYGQLFSQVNACDDSKVSHDPVGSVYCNVEPRSANA